MGGDAWRWLSRSSPPSFFGNIAFVAFILTQFLDGVFTYKAMSAWGLGVEANPLVGWVVSVLGIGLGLTVAKLVAVGLGGSLYWKGIHNAVVSLTLIYLCVAIIRWAYLFWTL